MSEGDRFLDSRLYPVKSFIFSLDPERNYAYTKSKLGLFRGGEENFPHQRQIYETTGESSKK